MDRHTRRPHWKRQSLVLGMSRHDRLRANWSNEISDIGPFLPSILDRDWTPSHPILGCAAAGGAASLRLAPSFDQPFAALRGASAEGERHEFPRNPNSPNPAQCGRHDASVSADGVGVALSTCAFGLVPISSAIRACIRHDGQTRDGDLTRCCHRLLWAAIARRADIYSSIQTATAAYLAVYITSHLIAVFILGLMFLGIDTTFEWASGAPTGLLHDPWNVRLIPHYSLAPLFVISHLAMGLRGILLGHGVRAAFANRLAWVICAIGLGVSLVIAVAQLSVRS